MGTFREAIKSVPGVRPAGVRVRAAAQATARTARRWAGMSDAERIAALCNRHAGRRGWIIANGPSLGELDLSLLEGEVTFGCNSIFLLYDRLAWRPTYYCVEDPLVAEDNAEAIRALTGSLKLVARDLGHLLPRDARTIHTEFIRGEPPGFPRFSDRPDRVTWFGGTVVYFMLQWAAWMGLNPIYLIGADMRYDVPDSAEVEGEVITSRADDVNHFDPLYFGAGKRWHKPYPERMMRCLAHAGRHLSKRGVRLYNATRGGLLEALPRVRYEEVLAARASVEAAER
jgi:hypothetical protein